MAAGHWLHGRRAHGGVYSFSAYLFHIPLYALLAVGLPDRQSLLQFVVAVVCCVIGVILLARVTEHRKATWRRVIHHLLARLLPERLSRRGT